MLYDPKWSKEIKADPFSLESLIAWLEKQPENAGYCVTDSGGCMVAQWLQSIDRTSMRSPPHRGDSFTYYVNGSHQNFRSAFANIAFGFGEPRTFGAALTRAREALAQRSFENADAWD